MDTDENYRRYLTELFGLLDKYLVSDLITLINEIPARPQGGVGYPALHTILSSMELLGLVLSGKKNDDAFTFYWNQYLCAQFPQYQTPKLVDIFRQVMRNGTAHLFIVKAGVSISKDGRNHLKPVDFQDHKQLNVDLIDLHSHFIQTYEEIKKGVLSNPVTAEIRKGCEALDDQMTTANNTVNEYLKANFSSPTKPVSEFPTEPSHWPVIMCNSTTVTASGSPLSLH